MTWVKARAGAPRYPGNNEGQVQAGASDAPGTEVDAMAVEVSRRVLVVDDDASVRESLQFLLEIVGYRTATFASPQECLAALATMDVACLVIDQHMPGQTGLELVAELRRRGVHAPALLITGSPSASLQRRAQEMDGMRVLAKPPGEDELLRFVAAAVT